MLAGELRRGGVRVLGEEGTSNQKSHYPTLQPWPVMAPIPLSIRGMHFAIAPRLIVGEATQKQ